MKVGDYVRTKNGIITKIIGNRKNLYGEETIFKLDKEISIYDLELNDIYLITNPLAEDTTNEIDIHFGDEKIIKKSSPNIIDLIEVGDYINGLRVEKNKYGELYTSYVYYGGDIGKQSEVYTTWLEEYKKNEDYIDSIITHEQIENMEYKVKE